MKKKISIVVGWVSFSLCIYVYLCVRGGCLCVQEGVCESMGVSVCPWGCLCVREGVCVSVRVSVCLRGCLCVREGLCL